MATYREGNCAICGQLYPYLDKDHIIPKWRGGTDEASNHQYICPNCHRIKTFAEQQSEEYRTHQIQFGGYKTPTLYWTEERRKQHGQQMKEFARTHPELYLGGGKSKRRG